MRTIFLLSIIITIIYGKDTYICPGNNIHKIIYKLPKTYNCDTIQMPNKTIRINIYQINREIYKSPSFKISISKRTCNSEWGIFRNNDHKSEKFITLPNKDYITINETLKYEIGGEIIMLEQDNEYNNIFKNKGPDYICVHNIFSDSVTTHHVITLIRDYVYVNNDMMISPIMNVENCKYEDKFCVYSHDVLIWDKNADYEKKYELLKKNITVMLIIDDNGVHHIIDEDLHIGYTILNMTPFKINNTCDHCVSTSNPYIILEIINSDNDPTEHIISTDKIKRSISAINNKISHVISSNLLDQYNNLEVDHLRIKFKKICNMVNYNYEFWKETCKTNAISCAEKFLNITYIDAEYVNGYLIISKCLPVEIINFKPRKIDNKCSVLIPVRYTHMNNEYDGYLDYETYMIYKDTMFYNDNECNSQILIEYQSLLRVYDSNLGILLTNYTIYDNIEINKIIKNTTSNIIPRPIALTSISGKHIQYTTIVKNSNNKYTGYVIYILIIMLSVSIIIYIIFKTHNHRYINISENEN